MNLGARTLASLLSFTILALPAPAQRTRAPQPQASAASSSIDSPFAITGTVVNSATGAPVSHCRVTAFRSDRIAGDNSNRGPGNFRGGGPGGPGGPPNNRRPNQQDSAETDATGRFTLHVASAGSWSLRANANGYRPQSLDEHDEFSTAVVLTSQAPTFDVLYRLTPDSAIAGLVLDEAGDPVRQARVSVITIPSAVDPAAQPSQRTSQAITDDRGHYEVAGLAPGNYRLSVNARPWYATSMARIITNPNSPPPLPVDPSLDVVYPTTWFPGTADENSANTITLHGGESRQADIHLLPIPSVHLLIPAPPPVPTPISSSPSNPPQPRFTIPRIEAVTPGENFTQTNISLYGGQYDIGGLGPGVYHVTSGDNGRNNGPSTTIVVTPNSARTLDISAAAVSTTVTILADGTPEADSIALAFVDATNPRNVFHSNGGRPGDFNGPPEGFTIGGRASFSPPDGGFTTGGFGIAGSLGATPTLSAQPVSVQLLQLQGQAAQADSSPIQLTQARPSGAQPPGNPRQPGGPRGGQRDRPARTVELPPGDYIVYQEGSPNGNLYLTGLTLGTKDLPGRLISIPDGASTLTVHVASGRANITGFTTLDSKPAVGAMVVLVPITLGQPGSLAEIRRDQANTDGSFDLPSVIPAQYILIAIDRGWNIKWSDPATLSRYLANGIPLDLRSPATIKQNLEAQQP